MTFLYLFLPIALACVLFFLAGYWLGMEHGGERCAKASDVGYGRAMEEALRRLERSTMAEKRRAMALVSGKRDPGAEWDWHQADAAKSHSRRADL